MAKNEANKGKQNAVNMGDVSNAIANSNAGRARKRADRAAKQGAWQRAFEERCKAALPVKCVIDSIDDSSFLDQEIVVSLSKEVRVLVKKTKENPNGFEMKKVSGHIIVVTEQGNNPGQPTVRVVASDFGPIPASLTYLPVLFLFSRQLKQYLPNEMHAQQCELHMALRSVLRTEISERLEQRHAESFAQVRYQSAKTSTEQAQQGVEDSQPMERAVQLRVADLVARPKNWEVARNFLFHSDERGIVYFRRIVDGGAAKLVLVKATDDHELAPLLDGHAGLKFDIAPILSEGPVEAAGDMHDVRVARMLVQNFMRRVVVKLGYCPQWSQGQEAVQKTE